MYIQESTICLSLYIPGSTYIVYDCFVFWYFLAYITLVIILSFIKFLKAIFSKIRVGPPIRTTVCLGKIAKHLHYSTRQKVLISAFTGRKCAGPLLVSQPSTQMRPNCLISNEMHQQAKSYTILKSSYTSTLRRIRSTLQQFQIVHHY